MTNPLRRKKFSGKHSCRDIPAVCPVAIIYGQIGFKRYADAETRARRRRAPTMSGRTEL